MGLGGKGTESDGFGFAPPVNESEVVNPSRMVAFGDSVAGWKNTFRDGGIWLSRNPTSDGHVGSTKRTKRRHSGKLNIGFCDGHVESLDLAYLFSDTSDAALSIWNRDGLPHRERLVE